MRRRASAAAAESRAVYRNDPAVVIRSDKDGHVISDRSRTLLRGLDLGGSPRRVAAAELRYEGRKGFLFVVVDGRSTGYSRGMTMTEFAQVFADLGAETAYNLDGGGSSAMVFNGQLVNNPLGRGRERGTSRGST